MRYDYQDLLRRYVLHARSRSRGRDLLDEYAPFQLSDVRMVNATAPVHEKVGGTADVRPEGGWFARALAGLPKR